MKTKKNKTMKTRSRRSRKPAPDKRLIAVGAKLRGWREFKKITQAEAAKRLGWSQSTVSDFEAGRREMGPNYALGISELCRLYGRSIKAVRIPVRTPVIVSA